MLAGALSLIAVLSNFTCKMISEMRLSSRAYHDKVEQLEEWMRSSRMPDESALLRFDLSPSA
jgi:hypothetical protein